MQQARGVASRSSDVGLMTVSKARGRGFCEGVQRPAKILRYCRAALQLSDLEVYLKCCLVKFNDMRLDSLVNVLDILRYQEFVGNKKLATSYCGRHLLLNRMTKSWHFLFHWFLNDKDYNISKFSRLQKESVCVRLVQRPPWSFVGDSLCGVEGDPYPLLTWSTSRGSVCMKI